MPVIRYLAFGLMLAVVVLIYVVRRCGRRIAEIDEPARGDADRSTLRAGETHDDEDTTPAYLSPPERSAPRSSRPGRPVS